ncbi:hypothetical protein, partial [Lachnobacterium bovis]|uniref:hypothetical protein n=1 Tax=Lachnobacterium bovis TaxID=140626 RepID=UPI001A99BAB1
THVLTSIAFRTRLRNSFASSRNSSLSELLIPYLKSIDFISSLIILFIYTIVNGIGNSKLDLEDCISFMREKLVGMDLLKNIEL